MSAGSSRTLAHAPRPAVVVKYIAQLWLPLGGAVLVPAAVSLSLGETGFAWRAVVVLAIVAAAAVPAARLRAPAELGWNEALTVIAGMFVTGALALVWPLTAFGLSPVDALFESVSAITTTGLTTVADVAAAGPAFLFTRAWVQWYAGYLIVVVGLALVFPPGAATKRFAQSGLGNGDIVGGTRSHARHTALVYIVLTAAALLATVAAGVPIVDALLHVLTAVSTAGFSTHGDSIAALPWAGQVVLMTASLLGAVSFALYRHAAGPRWRKFWRDSELATLLACCLVASIALVAILGLGGGMSWADALMRAPLLAVSAQSTTGFEPLSPAALDPGSKLILTASMLIGGDVGSTAGGIKIIRLLVLIGLLRLTLVQTALPRHAYTELRVTGRRIEFDELTRVLAVVLLFLLVTATSWLVFVLAGHPVADSLFEVTSAVGTVGLSTGLASPDLAPGLKILLCVDMLAGRVEVIALLILLYPATWLGRHR